MERIRPAARRQGDSGSSGQAAPRPAPASSSSSLSSKVFVIALVVVGVALLIGMSLIFFRGNGASGAVKSGQYQAVFLTNGQVYFGKLSNVDSSYVQLEDIYYLQVTQQNQQQLQEGENDASADPQISLAKLGNELHGPEDSMYISRDQVLFWENLKADDSQVVTAIENYTTEGQGQNNGGDGGNQ